MLVHFHGGPRDAMKIVVEGDFAPGDPIDPPDMPRIGYGRYRVTQLVWSTDAQGHQHFEYAEAEWGD